MPSRRNFLLAGGALAGVALASRPSDTGGPYPPYFASLNATLRREGIDRPVLLIDLDRLERNIDRVVLSAAIAPAKTYRIVVKSVPSPALVDTIARRANTRALMIFHRPFLQAMCALRPDADILIGKPMPIVAAQRFYAEHSAQKHGAFDPSKQLQWLIDTEARLAQYLALARSLGTRLRVNLELDVGLRRGGFGDVAGLKPALELIAANPDHLQFAGFMGYDAHLMGLPGPLITGEKQRIRERYSAALALLREQFPALALGQLCLNGAGSPTFRHYEGEALINDISVGSALMKPTHYDLPELAEFEPSCFIASPVLKRLPGARLPALDIAAPLLRAWNPNAAQHYFCYSGNWLAENEAPPGMTPHFAYTSSNQQGYQASAKVDIDVDDFIFLRPTQSEAVLLQFGDLVAFRGERIEARWPVLPVGV
jgi:D-serine deaminase-like pyridoxal phosphate-dependent protein